MGGLKAFGGGFFGCFGVLAAIVAVPVFLLILGGIGAAFRSDGRAGQPALDGVGHNTRPPPALDYRDACALAYGQAVARYGLGKLKPAAEAPTVTRDPDSGVLSIECKGRERRGEVVYNATFSCEEVRATCVLLQVATLNGRAQTIR